MTPTYLGDIELNEETLAHFGVKGMKWGKRKAKLKSDLKWKASKLKNKKLELETKINRKKKNMKSDDISTWNGTHRLDASRSILFGPTIYSHVDDGKARSTTRPTGNQKRRTNMGYEYTNVEDNTGYSKQPDKKKVDKAWSKYTYKDTRYDEGPKYKGVQKKYSGGENWNPKTRDERISKKVSDYNKRPESERGAYWSGKRIATTEAAKIKNDAYLIEAKKKKKK